MAQAVDDQQQPTTDWFSLVEIGQLVETAKKGDLVEICDRNAISEKQSRHWAVIVDVNVAERKIEVVHRVDECMRKGHDNEPMATYYRKEQLDAIINDIYSCRINNVWDNEIPARGADKIVQYAHLMIDSNQSTRNCYQFVLDCRYFQRVKNASADSLSEQFAERSRSLSIDQFRPLPDQPNQRAIDLRLPVGFFSLGIFVVLYAMNMEPAVALFFVMAFLLYASFYQRKIMWAPFKWVGIISLYFVSSLLNALGCTIDINEIAHAFLSPVVQSDVNLSENRESDKED